MTQKISQSINRKSSGLDDEEEVDLLFSLHAPTAANQAESREEGEEHRSK